MSRMFLIVESDGRRKDERISSSKRNRVTARWGSLNKSKVLYNIEVRWDYENESPIVNITLDDNVISTISREHSAPQNMRGTGESGWCP